MPATERSTFRYGIATGEARLRREAISSINSDTLREELYFSLNLIFYLTCKTKLVLFSTNFILALSPQAYFVWFFDEVRLRPKGVPLGRRAAGKRTIKN